MRELSQIELGENVLLNIDKAVVEWLQRGGRWGVRHTEVKSARQGSLGGLEKENKAYKMKYF
jgi:hypothetical protein